MGKKKELSIRRIAQMFLATPVKECQVSERDFGGIIKKPNYFQRPIKGLYNGFNVLNQDRQYLISEMLLVLNPKKSTPMMSHEGELYELVRVIGPGNINYKTHMWLDNRVMMSNYKQHYLSGEVFRSVNANNMPNGEPDGFYHSLANPDNVKSLAHIITIAEKRLGFKDGKRLEFGLNRPPNSYKPTK